jgi:pyruvate/2-oxoglutarate dehydrogenase complex dihydrolipoamide acyltransferase (E2) component
MNESSPVLVPRENVNDESVTIVSWLVAVGDKVSADQTIAEVEGSKAVFEVKANRDGFVRYELAEGDDVAVGSVICHICDTPRDIAQEPESVPVGANDGNGASQAARFSKGARRLLEERGVDESAFAGCGLVRARDILEHLGEQPPAQSAKPAVAVQSPTGAVGVPTRSEPLSRSKRTEAKYIASGYHNTLQSAVTVAVPTKGLKAAAELHPQLEGNTTAVVVFETARLLKKYPLFNAYHDSGKVCFYDEINVGLAVDSGQGLKVPVIRLADGKGLPELADEIRDLLVAYLEDELPVESLAGGTFTVTDLSSEGVLTFHPLINQGQSAILGVGAEYFPPGSREGVFNLVLTFDHQLAEGRLAARFLGELRDRLRGYEDALRQSTASQSDKDEPCCSRCLTPYGQLREMNHYLVQTVRSDGSVAAVCTVCMQGW